MTTFFTDPRNSAPISSDDGELGELFSGFERLAATVATLQRDATRGLPPGWGFSLSRDGDMYITAPGGRRAKLSVEWEDTP